MDTYKQKHKIWFKAIALIVACLFLFNDLANALGPAVTSSGMGPELRPGTKEDMYALGQKLFGIKRGPGAIKFDIEPEEFIGKTPKIDGTKFIKADYKKLPQGWENNPLLECKDLIKAFEYFRDHEAQIPADKLEIREGYFDVDEEAGELPIARIEVYNTPGVARSASPGVKIKENKRYVLVIHTKFVQMWNHIRRNDVWFEIEIEGQKRTISVAWGIFYCIAKHEMTDLKKQGLSPKGTVPVFKSLGHISMLAGELKVSRDEYKANTISGNYKHINDSIWLWFLGSYAFGNPTRYNNDLLKKRLLWFFENDGTKMGTVPSGTVPILADEFPHLKDAPEEVIDAATDLACAINYHFFSDKNGGIKKSAVVPELTVSSELRREYQNRELTRIGKPIYATGGGETVEINPNSWKTAADITRDFPFISKGAAKGILTARKGLPGDQFTTIEQMVEIIRSVRGVGPSGWQQMAPRLTMAGQRIVERIVKRFHAQDIADAFKNAEDRGPVIIKGKDGVEYELEGNAWVNKKIKLSPDGEHELINCKGSEAFEIAVSKRLQNGLKPMGQFMGNVSNIDGRIMIADFFSALIPEARGQGIASYVMERIGPALPPGIVFEGEPANTETLIALTKALPEQFRNREKIKRLLDRYERFFARELVEASFPEPERIMNALAVLRPVIVAALNAGVEIPLSVVNQTVLVKQRNRAGLTQHTFLVIDGQLLLVSKKPDESSDIEAIPLSESLGTRPKGTPLTTKEIDRSGKAIPPKTIALQRRLNRLVSEFRELYKKNKDPETGLAAVAADPRLFEEIEELEEKLDLKDPAEYFTVEFDGEIYEIHPYKEPVAPHRKAQMPEDGIHELTKRIENCQREKGPDEPIFIYVTGYMGTGKTSLVRGIASKGIGPFEPHQIEAIELDTINETFAHTRDRRIFEAINARINRAIGQGKRLFLLEGIHVMPSMFLEAGPFRGIDITVFLEKEERTRFNDMIARAHTDPTRGMAYNFLAELKHALPVSIFERYIRIGTKRSEADVIIDMTQWRTEESEPGAPKQKEPEQERETKPRRIQITRDMINEMLPSKIPPDLRKEIIRRVLAQKSGFESEASLETFIRDTHDQLKREQQAKGSFDDNVSCGTICEDGHQELLDPQIAAYYTALAKVGTALTFSKAFSAEKVSAVPTFEEHDVIQALGKAGILEKLGITTAQLTEIIEYIHREASIPSNIQLLFAIPNMNDLSQKLWWIKHPKTGEELYAGGHFNKLGTRIHISLPLILSQENPKEAALAIARHDYNHILGNGHQNDEGMRIVKGIALKDLKPVGIPTERASHPILAYVYSLISVILWGLWAPIAQLTIENQANKMPAISVLFYQCFFSTITLFILTIFTKEHTHLMQGGLETRKKIKKYMIMSALGVSGIFVYPLLALQAIALTNVVEASVLNYLWPMSMVISSAIILKEEISKASFIGILLGFLGTFIIITKGTLTAVGFTSLPGNLMALGGAIIWALFSTLNKYYKFEPMSSMFFYSAAALFICSFPFVLGGYFIIPNLAQFLGLLYLGAVAYGFAQAIWLKALKTGEAHKVANVGLLTPFATAAAIILLIGKGSFLFSHYLGFLFIVGGGLLDPIYKFCQGLGTRPEGTHLSTENEQNGAKKQLEEEKTAELVRRRDRLTAAIAILSHGGPLDIANRATGIIGGLVNCVRCLFEDDIQIALLLWKPLELKRKEFLKLYHSYCNKIVTRMEELGEKNSLDKAKIEALSDEYRKWLEEMKALYQEINSIKGKIIEKMDGKSDEELSGILEDAEYWINRALMNLEAVSVFIQEENILDQLETIDLKEWLTERRNTWETKGKFFPVSDNLHTIEGDPMISARADSSLLHMAIERFISNGFHAIERSQKEDSSGSNINLSLGLSEDKKNAQIIISNPGEIPEEALEIDPESGFPKLFSIDYERKNFYRGIGLKFAVRAIWRMGGTVSVRNVEKGSEKSAEVIVELPLAAGDAMPDSKASEEKEHPLVTIISEYIVQLKRSEGPGSEKKIRELTFDETKSVYQTTDLLRESGIEIVLPKEFNLTPTMKKAIKDIKKKSGARAVDYKEYVDMEELSGLLNEKPAPGVKKIVLTVPGMAEGIKTLAEKRPDLFKDLRLLNVQLPKDYMDMRNTENLKTIYQSRIIMMAILARLLEKGGNNFVRDTLRFMLEEALAGPADAAALIKKLEEGASVKDLLDSKYVINFVKELEKEIRLMETFWTAA